VLTDRFLVFGQNISSLEFQCHTVSGERLAVVISTLFHDESAVVGRHVVALICKQGGFIYPFAVLDLVSIVLSFKTRT
jgi:hypothetical protein